MVGPLLGRVLRATCVPCGHLYAKMVAHGAQPAAGAVLGSRVCRRPLDHARAWLSALARRRRQAMSGRTGGFCAVGLAASWFSVLTVQSDCDQVDFEMLVKNKIVDEAEEQDGWERLTAMYTLDEMGGLTPELEFVANTGTAGMFFGGALGAILSSRVAIQKFLEKNQVTAFETPLQAKRAMQDRVMIGMFRGFFIFGWRTAVLTSSFALVSTTLMVYSNKVSALHYTAAGAVTGALYKVNMGLRGMFAGALAGSLLGLAGGTVISLVCYISGTTMPEIRAQQYVWKHQQALRQQARMERRRERKRKAGEESPADQAPHAAVAAAAAVAPSAVAAAAPSDSDTAAVDQTPSSDPTASAANSHKT